MQLAAASVVPMIIGGHHSAPFQFVGRIHARLRTLLLPRELLNKAGTSGTVFQATQGAGGSFQTVDFAASAGKYLAQVSRARFVAVVSDMHDEIQACRGHVPVDVVVAVFVARPTGLTASPKRNRYQ